MLRALPVELNGEQIRRTLSPYSFFPDNEQIALIQAYLDLLLKWNRSINLTAITNPLEIVRRHFGESTFGLRLLPVENCRLVDIGTGAGFPGLALKIAHPSIHLSLIESNRKKSAFLAETVRTLKFSDAAIRTERFEGIRAETVQADIITARAVGQFKELMRWSREALAPRGHVMLWIGAEDSTRITSHSDWIWQPAVHIPESQRRFILVGRPIRKPPEAE